MGGEGDKTVTAAERLRAAWLHDPPAARVAIIRALETTGGNATRAAELLGISHRTMLRYLRDSGVAAAAERLRAARRGKANGQGASS